MSDTTQSSKASGTGDSERTKQVTVAGYTAGVSAVVALGTLYLAPTWPVALGVGAISAMVASTCYFMLKK